MKRFLIFLGVLFLFCSCEKSHFPYNPIPEAVLSDFETRYPGANLTSDRYGEDYQGWAILEFVDVDGLKATAHYKDGIWMMTNKEYSKEDFIYQLPRSVARTYIGSGVDNEDYTSDNSYVMEISRRYFKQKQYEFQFQIPFKDEDEPDGIVLQCNSIVIDEDGNLLYHKHGSLNPSYWWKDITSSLNCVSGFLPMGAKILGSVNENGDNLIFFLDNGIIKTAKSSQGRGWAWTETRYKVVGNDPLPDAVIMARDQYLYEHKDLRFNAMYNVETPQGLFYGIEFEKADADTWEWFDWRVTIYIPQI
jgi:hypothetical protein